MDIAIRCTSITHAHHDYGQKIRVELEDIKVDDIVKDLWEGDSDKVFDSIPHDEFLNKLDRYEIMEDLDFLENSVPDVIDKIGETDLLKGIDEKLIVSYLQERGYKVEA